MTNKKSYQDYLKSEQWSRLRKQAYERAKNLCELCGLAGEAVHHIQYPKNLEDDILSNLLVVCKNCHEKLHGIRDEFRFTKNKLKNNKKEVENCNILGDAIKINNRLFNRYDKITGNDIIILGVLQRHGQGLTTDQLKQELTARATKKTCISKRTMIKCKKRLLSYGMIEVKEGIRRRGKSDLWKAKQHSTYGMGYTIVSNGAINGAIDGRVTPTQLKIYLLLLKYAFCKPTAYPSTLTLAKELRTSQPTVSKQLQKLEKNDFIDRYIDYTKTNGSLVTRLLV